MKKSEATVVVNFSRFTSSQFYLPIVFLTDLIGLFVTDAPLNQEYFPCNVTPIYCPSLIDYSSGSLRKQITLSISLVMRI